MPFAEVSDVQTRLGGRDLTESEEALIEALLEGAQSVIETYVGKVEDDFDEIPAIVKMATVAVVVRAMANPEGLSSIQEQLGAHAVTKSFGRDLASELTLTQGEQLVLRRAVWGKNAASAKLRPAALDDIAEETGATE